MKIALTKIHLLLNFTALFFFLSAGLVAQDMEITDASTAPFTPENLITNIFLGDGVDVLNVSYEGDPQAAGFFKDAENAIGIDRGILLTSGRASSVNCGGGPLGADCPGNQFSSNDMNSSASDSDLSDIANGTPQDVAKYTITFIPTSDTLRFKYVFASEEYPEFSCDIFNDVFGFFISGPGITGPFSNNGENIATIPGTNTPVSIDNIHPDDGPGCNGENDQFYNDNEGLSLQPVYDGYLDVFVAEVVVIPCETYTIKLLISDVGDNFYDSGVFLEAKSFGTGTLQVESATLSLDGTITEGCSNGSFTFTLANEAEEDFPLDYTIVGDAINGVDYLYIDSTLFIPSGENSITIDGVGIEDDLPEGLERVGIDIQRDICNRDTFWMFIRENTIVPPQLQADTLICAGDSVALDGTLPLPLPEPPSFSNFQDYDFDATEPVFSPILVAGVQPTTLGEGVIQSVCVNIEHKWIDDIDLFLISPSGQFIELSSDNGSNCDNYTDVCFSPSANTPINYLNPWPVCSAGEAPPFAGSTFQPEGVWSDLWDGEFSTNGTWQLLVVDDQNGFNGTILDWTITFEPLYQVFYKWQPTNGLSCSDCPDPMAGPSETTTYFLTASDNYGCEVYDTITVEVIDFLPAPLVNCISTSSNSITFAWEEIFNATGYQVSINGGAWQMPNNGLLSHLVNGLNLSETISIEVRATGECDGAIGTTTCSTPDCSSPQLNIDNINHISCFGNLNGSINASATGGAGNYTFSINGSSNNSTGNFNVLPAGIYEISVIDDLGCPNSINVIIEQPDSLFIVPSVINHLTCFGDTDGSATVEITGGTAPFNYIWANGESQAVASSLEAGTQAIQIQDVNGCFDIDFFEILEPAKLTSTVETDSVKCFGTNTGAATAMVQGGVEPYLLDWGNAGTNTISNQVFGVATGSYSLEIEDGNGCTINVGFDIFEPEGMITNVAATDLACANANTATATVSVAGGNAPFTYNWSNNDTEATADSLTAATYQVVITDSKGCSATDSISISSPPPLTVSLSANATSCFGEASGSVISVVEGGTPPYTYSWDSNSTDTNLLMASAGEHCLTVLDANGCEATACDTVFEPAQITLSATTLNAGCDGGTAGEIDLSIMGGAAPFQFAWDNGSDTEDLTGLAAGSYSVVVTDGNGCTAEFSETISETSALVIDFTQNDVLCVGENTGSIELEVQGGSGNYTFSWAGPNSFSSDQKDLSNIAAGSYTISAEDTDGCSAVLNIVIDEPDAPVQVAIAPADLICFGSNDGSAIATATGGTGGFSFAWSNTQSTVSLENVSAGIYSVTATDSNGCEATEQIEIVQQEELNLVLSQTPASCNNATDGTASISSINQGGTVLTPSDVQINWSNANSQATATELTGGETYTATITNNLGCSASESIVIGNPDPIGASVVSVSQITCFEGQDGAITVTGEGGTLPYSYQWNANANDQTSATASSLRAGSYTVIITDAGQCSTSLEANLAQPEELKIEFENQRVSCFGEADGSSLAVVEGGNSPYNFVWSSGDNSNPATALIAGALELNVTDANGCSVDANTEIIQPNTAVAASFSVVDASCPGDMDGIISIEPEGGSPPYSYSFNNADFTGNPVKLALNSGFYDVVIKDKNDCEFDLPDIFVGEPEPFDIDLGGDRIFQYGDTIHIAPELTNIEPTEFGNYTWQWSSNNPLIPPLNPNGRLSGFHVTSQTTVTLVATSKIGGCTVEDMVNFFVITEREVIVPTGFTPDNGGPSINNLLHVHGKSRLVENIKAFRVFDRWGELVYEVFDFGINDENIGWDGTFKGQDMPSGVYIWHAEVEYIDGLLERYKGQTTLIR